MSDPAIGNAGASVRSGSGAKARAFAPASVANVACGFDTFGFAVAGIGDVVVAQSTDTPGVTIEAIVGDDADDASRGFSSLPTDATRNTAGVAARALIDSALSDDTGSGNTGSGDTGPGNMMPGVSLRIEKGIPAGSGLGSSAASAVAAVVAVDALLGLRSTRGQLFDAALAGEAMVSRPRHGDNVHGDNVAPALEGGFQLVRLEAMPRCIRLPVPEAWRVVLLRPHRVIETAVSRGAIQPRILLADACFHWGNTAALVAGLFRGDPTIVAGALHDRIAEPVRASTVPCFDEVKAAASRAGALGCSLSGSGPTLFALCANPQDAERVARAMTHAFAPASLASDLIISPIGARGAHLIDPVTTPCSTRA